MYGQDSFFETHTVTDSSPQDMGPNPNYQGLRVIDRDDLFPRSFAKLELDAVYAELTRDTHDEGLTLESPDLAEVEFYNPGSDPVPDDFILEAITVEHFSRTERRMAAVVKVLNRHLKESEINALPPVVGKPRKTGAFAYVIVQLPFSDGQTVNVVFHSPEGDKKKITADDTIIAFRWLLNKRDITHVVAPEGGEEVSLETIAKRITQLVVKNSARFERQQKVAHAERQELETTRDTVKAAEDRQAELMDAVASSSKQAYGIEARLSNALAQLEKQRTINAELQAKIDALRAQRERVETNSTDSTDEQFAEILRIQKEVLSLSQEELAGLRRYSQGKDEDYGRRMPLSFIIKDKSDFFFYQLKSQPTPQAKYDFLQKEVLSGDMKAPKINNSSKFSDAVDMNKALREGKTFYYFELSPRKGYVLAILAIDLDGKKTWETPVIEKTTSEKADVKLHLPKTATRPEEIRVIFDDGCYLVQTRRDDGEWITQKEHGSETAAINDAEQWYPDEKQSAQNAPPAYARDLQDILDGRYDADTGKILELMGKAIDTAEQENQIEQYQSLLDAASNRLTELLAKEAA